LFNTDAGFSNIRLLTRAALFAAPSLLFANRGCFCF